MTELETQKLMDCAIKARENAYSPYSHFALLALPCYAKMVPFSKDAI